MKRGSTSRYSDNDNSSRNAAIISITSGKGGVGKTQICANLAVSMAEMGQRVCIVDADHGLANINIVLGIPANQQQTAFSSEDIHHQLYNNYNPQPFIITTELGIDLLPSISGLSVNTHNQQPSEEQIQQMLDSLRIHYDTILIDTAAGIETNVKNYISAADHSLVIINTEPTSLTDSFGLIRRMQNVSDSFQIIINRVPNADAATQIYKRFAGAVKKYIGCQLTALGFIREDSLVSAALLSQRVLVKYSPNCMASRCIKKLATRLIELSQSTQKHAKRKITKPAITPATTHATDVPSLNAIADTGNPQAVFDNWLDQIGQLINSENLTSKERNQRVKSFMSQLELICEKDKEFLSVLESLVINIGIGEELDKSSHTGTKLSRFNITGNSILS